MMRAVYGLVGLAKRYGPAAAEAACARALDVDVINVSKIESMLVNATEKNQAVQAAAPAGTRRFPRDPAEYPTATGLRPPVLDRGPRPRPPRPLELPAPSPRPSSPPPLFISIPLFS